MQNSEKKPVLSINAIVHAPLEVVWHCWTTPYHIMKWNTASPEWQTTYAENDLRQGGVFTSRMEAKDGSMGFDFFGTYDVVQPLNRIEYTLGDGRRVVNTFEEAAGGTWVVSKFEAESQNPLELQQAGWNSILQNFKKYAEKKPSAPARFEIEIEAPVSRVYQTMIDEPMYRQWTKVFNETSHYLGSWDKGSEILFVGLDGNGVKGGMVSRIKENMPDKFISIEHLGLLKGEDRIMEGPEVEPWAGGLENYHFFSTDKGCLLRVEMEMNEEFRSYFENTWPKALELIRQLAI